ALGVHGTVRIGADRLPAEAFDVVLECSGVPAAVSPALAAARRGAVVVQVGMVPNEARPVNLAPLVSKELQLRGSFRFDDEIDEAIELLAAHPGIEGVVTHEIPAERALEAFSAARDSAASGKVLVSFGQQTR
ncbi:zinc-binding dehydrogenase, partial [Kocuria oceani]